MGINKRKLKKVIRALGGMTQRFYEETTEIREKIDNYIINKKGSIEQLVSARVIIVDIISKFDTKTAKELVKNLNEINMEDLCNDK